MNKVSYQIELEISRKTTRYNTEKMLGFHGKSLLHLERGDTKLSPMLQPFPNGAGNAKEFLGLIKVANCMYFLQSFRYAAIESLSDQNLQDNIE